MPLSEDMEAQLRALAVRYALAADDCNPDAFADVFCPDGMLTVLRGEQQQTLSGRKALRAVPERLGRFERTFHLLGQSHYEIDGETATGTVYCTANHLLDGVNEVMHIRYRDSYAVCDDGRWRIQSRRVVVEWTEHRAAD
jgi:SnoaL-like domain